MGPLPEFDHGQRPTKRRRVEMPSVADGFTPRNLGMHVHLVVPKPPTPNPKTKTPLKQVLPPSFSLPNTKSLHPPPPPPSLQITPLDRDLKSISTTSIGLLNSLSSSNGGEDLAAFLLPHRDQSAVSLVTPTSRGIEHSPEKRGKYIRGGLAARASALYNRAHTSLVLWQKETERRARTSDLTATIVSILHRPPSNSKPSPVIALCRIHHEADPSTLTSYSYAPNQLYKIIFSLPLLSLDRFKQGLTVRIFHPWHELSFTSPVESSSTASSRRPPLASLPLPLSLPSTPDLPINSTTVLLCSRFTF